MKKFFESYLIERKEIADETIELTISKPKNFSYNLGQYVFLDLNNSEKNILDTDKKAFSISSHPDEDILRFVMRKSPSSFKQRCLNLEKGEKIYISSSKGNFSIDNKSGKSKGIVFLTSGMGIAPVIPMLMELKKLNSKKEVHLFYSNRTLEKTTYHNILENFKIENYNYHPVFTGIQPRINSDLLISKLGDLKKYKFYIIGTVAFIKTMKEILESNNLTKDDYLVDNYG